MARGVFMSRVKAKSEGAGSTEDLDKNDGLFLCVICKVVSFLSVAKDLANRWTNMVLPYSEATYRSWDGFRLVYFYKKSG